jgi:hypothetical protein
MTVTKPNGDNFVYTFTGGFNQIALTQVQAYTGSVSPANLLGTVATTWNPNHTQKSGETITVPVAGGTSISRTTQYAYDNLYFSNVSQVSEWKHYTGSLPATPDRVTSMTYTGANSSYVAKHIINKPTGVTIKSGGGTQLAQTLYSYDSASLISVSGVFSHDDTNYGISDTVRGNLTQIQRWTGGTSYLNTTNTYDTTGQLRSVQDPALNTTLFSYADNFFTDTSGVIIPPTFTAPVSTNAYLTQTTLPVSGSLTYGYYYGTGKKRVQLCRTLADNYSLNVQNNADYFRSMFVSAQTTDELRQLVAQTQERKKFAAMTPLEIKEYNRRQAAQQPEQRNLTQAEALKLEAEASGLPPLPGEDQFGNIIDSVYLNRLSVTDRHSFAGWVRRYGAANVVARMHGVR